MVFFSFSQTILLFKHRIKIYYGTSDKFYISLLISILNFFLFHFCWTSLARLVRWLNWCAHHLRDEHATICEHMYMVEHASCELFERGHGPSFYSLAFERESEREREGARMRPNPVNIVHTLKYNNSHMSKFHGDRCTSTCLNVYNLNALVVLLNGNKKSKQQTFVVKEETMAQMMAVRSNTDCARTRTYMYVCTHVIK